MQVRWIPEQSAFANSYIYGKILVDAGLPPMAISPYKEQIDTIILTHCHFDHTARVKEIASLCKAKVAIHKNDARGLVEDTLSLSMHFGARSPGIAPDIILDDGDILGELTVIHTPGHTPGSICLFSDRDHILISGDTVFSDGCFGRFDFPGGSRIELARSINRLSILKIEGLYPGHGEPVKQGGSRHIAAAMDLIKRAYG
jgi:hydroxyacylglutathione hydrolase